MTELEIIDVNKDNIIDYPPRCFLNPNHIGQKKKAEWTINRFSEGLKIKLLYLDKKLSGFIEYIPGEYTWRAVDAKGYLFIHCIWTNPKKIRSKGYGSKLVDEAVKDAKDNNMSGVAVVTSEGSFMTSKDLFLKNGFESADYSEPFDLMIKKLKDGPLPKFMDWKKQLENYKGLNIVYSKQCPWIIRSIEEIGKVIDENKLDAKLTELKTAKDAQNAPSIYSSFNLINNGKLLANHYISTTRFKNIIKKEGIR